MRALSPVVMLSVAALLLAGAACTRGGTAATPSPSKISPEPNSGGSAGAGTDSRPAATLPKIPGMDFSALAPSAQRELAQVLSDEFCYCGCPHTIGACLQSHDCRHARRMTKLAATELGAGASAVDTLLILSKYYKSFRDKRVTTLEVDERLCMGPKTAAITLVEFSDFECPYCGAARPVLEAFAKKNPEKVRFCFAPFPLEGHPNAMPAGLAALAARDQGKFWPMHDALFEHQTELSPAKIRQLAEVVGVGPQVAKALETRSFADELQKWKAAGKAAGVTSTPSLFVNGRKLTLPITEEALAHTVEDELEWAASSGWAKD